MEFHWKIILTTIPISFLIMIYFIMQGLRTFDQIMKLVYQKSPETWEKLQQPRGFFWKPESVKDLKGSYWARVNLFSTMTWREYPEVNEIEGATDLLSKYKRIRVITNLVCFIFVVQLPICFVLEAIVAWYKA